MTSKWLVVGPTPQATIAAMRQVVGKGDGGLMTNRTFASSIPGDRPIVGFSFTDTAKNLAGGYAALSLIGSALANAVRSPVDGERDPGLLVPLYNDLKRDVRPSVSFSYWQGDALVIESLTDRSVLVNAAGTLGVINSVLPIVAIPAMAGAAEQRRFGALGDNPYSALAFELARKAVMPFTAEHLALAAADSGRRSSDWIRWESWIGTAQPAVAP
jgi:hypothetical protein